MELHDLKDAPGARKKRKRVGRGPASGTGKTSGRGHKGQQSRSGHSTRPGFEGGQMPLHRRLPKRGFNHTNRRPVAIVNVDTLDKVFDSGAEVTAEAIIEKGLAAQRRGGVKVLGRGDVTKRIALKVQAVSPGARQKIEAAGGSVELIGNAAQEPRGQAKTAAATGPDKSEDEE